MCLSYLKFPFIITLESGIVPHFLYILLFEIRSDNQVPRTIRRQFLWKTSSKSSSAFWSALLQSMTTVIIVAFNIIIFAGLSSKLLPIAKKKKKKKHRVLALLILTYSMVPLLSCIVAIVVIVVVALIAACTCLFFSTSPSIHVEIFNLTPSTGPEALLIRPLDNLCGRFAFRFISMQL